MATPIYQVEYGRFSSKPQEEGDSTRRQKVSHDSFAAAHSLTPWPQRFFDRGKSGWTGAHRKGDFGRLLNMAESGAFPEGSVIVIEDMRRFSREPLEAVLETWRALIHDCGLRIGVCSHNRIYDRRSSQLDRMASIMESILAHQESQDKSDKVKAAYRTRRENAANGQQVEHRGPAWCDWDDQAKKWVENAGAQSIRFMFEMAEFCGQRKTLDLLQRQCPPMKGTKSWNLAYVAKVLNDRAVLGEHQHTTTDERGVRGPIGKPVKGYYPVVIDEAQWDRVHAAKKSRERSRGPSGKFVNIFTGLLFSSHDKCPMHVQKTVTNGKIQRRLVSYNHTRKIAGSNPVSVQLDVFEDALTKHLHEVEIPANNGAENSVKRLHDAEKELDGVNIRLAEIEVEFTDTSADRTPTAILKSSLQTLTDRQRRLKEEIAQLRSRITVNPFRESKTLIESMRDCPEGERHELRHRLRSILSQAIDSIWIMPEKHFGRVYFLVQVFFRDGWSTTVQVGGGVASRVDIHPHPLAIGFDLRKGPPKMPSPWFLQLAKHLVSPGEFIPPTTLPKTFGGCLDIWLQMCRSTMSADTYRMIPAKVRRFVDFIGPDTKTSEMTIRDWTAYFKHVKAEIAEGKIMFSTARVEVTRSREFLRWLNGQQVFKSRVFTNTSVKKLLSPTAYIPANTSI